MDFTESEMQKRGKRARCENRKRLIALVDTQLKRADACGVIALQTGGIILGLE